MVHVSKLISDDSFDQKHLLIVKVIAAFAIETNDCRWVNSLEFPVMPSPATVSHKSVKTPFRNPSKFRVFILLIIFLNDENITCDNSLRRQKNYVYFLGQNKVTLCNKSWKSFFSSLSLYLFFIDEIEAERMKAREKIRTHLLPVGMTFV